MAVSGLLAQYLSIQSQLTYYETQQTRWNDMSTAMSKKLSAQENQETKWESASGTVEDKWSDSNGNLSFKGETFLVSGKGYASYANKNMAEIATTYANKKVSKYDPDLLEEYSALDIEYSTMSNMYDTLITKLESEKDALKQQLGTEAQDTHMLSQ